MRLDFKRGCSSIKLTWNPPLRDADGGMVTGYRAQIKAASSEGPWTTKSVSQSTQSCLFTHLEPNSKYHVRVMAQNKMGIGWPSEVSTIQTGVPNTPVFNVISSENENECAVFVLWLREPSSTDCPVLFHTISYRRQGENEWTRLNITERNTNRQRIETECSTEYEFQVLAWNDVGPSPITTKPYTTKGYPIKHNERGISLEFILIYTFVGLFVILGAVLLALCINQYRKKGNQSTKRTAKDIQVLDGYEIPPIRTEFLELVGEGAFGKVHKATLEDGMAYFEDDRDWSSRPRKQKIIAVKELFENANEEERKEFMDEIELMKKIGKHQNVLSFFGCWTTTKPILLMIEYIAHGDLLHWLRHKRSQISSSMLKVTPGAAKDTELYAGTPTWNTNVIDDQNDVSTEKKTVTLGVLAVETRSAFDVMEQTGGVFYREEECKISMLVSSVSNQEVAETSNLLGTNAEPCTVDMMQQGEADFESEDDCKIPLIVFSPPNQAEDTERVEDRPNNSEASGGPSSTPDGKKEQGESDFDDDDQCKIPMTVFWSSIQEENAAPKTDEKECDNDCETFHPTDAMSFAWQIARGMSYLSEKGLVHRDLAARNILVGHGKKLKIGDFGLMREMYHELYEVKKQRKLPIKWMAPEAIYEQIFTSKSDVWSYGIVMWEIATLGGSPYPLLNNAEVMSLLRTGHRLEKPDLCSDNFYAFMMECWKQNPDERPSFQELVGRLEGTMTEQVEYLDLKQLDETKAYYPVQEPKTGEIGGDSGLGMHRAVSLISIVV
ncbi:unnamed protein product [Porites evermanni]|uniref:receptor protein-tyrosine kinase n=1 Tax=Porites evermanni TaxID=104178 RepID=A0ABN8PEZ7_9CNID|nr:unnamed protein product [Porites evermanni]